MPYFCASSTPQYNETLDKIHAIAETVNSPIILLGDMNAHLPQQNNLSVNWYKQRPFNRHSVLLHDLLSEHSMLSAIFKFKQSLSYTYFNYTSRSYIDHILVSEGIYDNVISCAILPHSDDNLSDHLRGVPRIWEGGRPRIFFFRFGNLHVAKRHAAHGEAMRIARGVRGNAPPRKFFKTVQFGAF